MGRWALLRQLSLQIFLKSMRKRNKNWVNSIESVREAAFQTKTKMCKLTTLRSFTHARSCSVSLRHLSSSPAGFVFSSSLFFISKSPGFPGESCPIFDQLPARNSTLTPRHKLDRTTKSGACHRTCPRATATVPLKGEKMAL